MVGNTSRVLICCACALLAAAVAVAVVAVLFHPKKSETSRLIAELESKMHCVRCFKNEERYEDTCKSCFSSSKQRADDCNLDGRMRDWIPRIVSAVKQSTGFMTSLLREANNSWLHKLSNDRLNTPRPSAHWYLSRRMSRNMPDTEQQYKKISPWVSATATGLAHSKNGMTNMNGQMNFNEPGWYRIYFQTEIHSNVSSSDSRYIVRAVIKNPKKENQYKYLMQRKETVDCALKHQNQKNFQNPDLTTTEGSTHAHKHPCVKLKASVVYRVFTGDVLKLEADIPDKATFDKHLSRSYMGALYLHQPPMTY